MLIRLFALFFAASIPLVTGCRASEEEAKAKPMTKVEATTSLPAPSAAAPNPSVSKGPTTLLELPSSAYSALLHSDGDALYVATPKEVARITRAESIDRQLVRLDSAMSARHDEIVFVAAGALRRYVWGAKEPSLLAKTTSSPERLAASDRGIFLLDRTSNGRSRISAEKDGNFRAVYESESTIATLAAKNDVAFFVETSDAGFRVASVTTDGKKTFGAVHPGRTPSALTLTDAVYYYDGPLSEVRRASLALATEEVVAKDVVCSPLHVDERIYCAYPGGISALALDGNGRAELPVNARGPITALAAFADRLIWIEDAGADRLVVRSLPR